MFTRQELNILQAALQGWDGPYGEGATLNKDEQARVENELKIAEALGLRFQGILYDYYEMEQAYLNPLGER